MPFIDFKTKRKVKFFEGITGFLHHSDSITFAHITLQKGAIVAEHHHIHEQWTHVIEGEMEFVIGGEKRLLRPGMAAFIPSNAVHSAVAATECKVIDCFMPVREDFIQLEKQTT